MLSALYKARERLVSRGIWNREMVMVLFGMLEEGVSYSESLRAYAEYEGKSICEVERAMETAAINAGIWSGARYILERCYQEAIQ